MLKCKLFEVDLVFLYHYCFDYHCLTKIIGVELGKKVMWFLWKRSRKKVKQSAKGDNNFYLFLAVKNNFIPFKQDSQIFFWRFSTIKKWAHKIIKKITCGVLNYWHVNKTNGID